MKLTSVILVASASLVGCASGPSKTDPAGVAIDKAVKKEVVIAKFPAASLEAADKFIEGRLKLLDGLLNPPPDPYFGKREPGPTCETSKLPPRSESKDGKSIATTMHLYATAEKVYGACNKDVDVLRTQTTWLYCPGSREVIEAKYFYPASKDWVTQPVARCL